MQIVARRPQRKQIPMSLDRIRQEVACDVAMDIVLAVYRVMSGNRQARVEDMSPAATATLATEVRDFLSTMKTNARILLVHQLTGHDHAIAESAQRDLDRQVARDRQRAHDLTAVKSIVPGICCLCTKPTGTDDRAQLEVTASLNADVHERCAQDHPSVEIVSSFGFRIKGGNQ